MMAQETRDFRAETPVCAGQRTNISFLLMVDHSKTLVQYERSFLLFALALISGRRFLSLQPVADSMRDVAAQPHGQQTEKLIASLY